MKPLQWKMVQLDLARQMESPETIREFIGLAKDSGYNAILLYLEDRIRTKSYPYPAENESYSEEDIREIVKFADAKQIALIPCVATLGHAERFLRHPQLVPLAEGEPGQPNRFGNSTSPDVFCMNHPEFYPFMESYLAEIAALFPAPYFHIGLDEFFNFNLCKRCREKMQSLAAEEDAFLEHIVRIRNFLHKLGKQAMMWSDMFEIYTTVLPRIPKDVIVIDWQYQEDVRFYMGHLFEQGIEQRSSMNRTLGLKSIAASWDRCIGNPASAVFYAKETGADGFLMTIWECSDSYLERNYPIMIYTGNLLNGFDRETAWKNTMKLLFGSSDPLLSRTIALICTQTNLLHYAEVSESNLLSRPYAGLPLNQMEQNHVLKEMLLSAGDRITTPLGQRIWKELCFLQEEKVVAGNLKQAFWNIFDFGYSKGKLDAVEKVSDSFTQLITAKEKAWDSFRKGITPNNFSKDKDGLIRDLQEKISSLETKSILRTRFFVPDYYVINSFSIQLRFHGEWQTVVQKDSSKSESLYEYITMLDCTEEPEAIRYDVWGMGGRGIAYAEIRDRQGSRYVPEAILSVSGIVDHAEYLLENDCKYAWFGAQTTRFAYFNPDAASLKNSVEIRLKKIKGGRHEF